MSEPRGPIDLLWLDDPACCSRDVAGGKGASLSRMLLAGVLVPPGFVIPPSAFEAIAAVSGVDRFIVESLVGLDVRDPLSLSAASRTIQNAILGGAPLPDLVSAINKAYGRLGGSVAVRSSAIVEDSSAASYAGQQDTFLDIAGPEAVLARIRDCWASFFSEHAIFYRQQKGRLDDYRMAVIVQRLVVAEKAGVMFTIDPVSRRRDRFVVEAVWGLGESLVSGVVTPDNYQVARADGRVIHAFVSEKATALVRDGTGGPLRQVNVSPDRRTARVLSDDELSRLVDLGRRLEELFGSPQDIEWTIADGKLYALQSRPVTTLG